MAESAFFPLSARKMIPMVAGCLGFVALGVILILVGLGISAYLAVLRFSGESIGDRPLLLLGVLLIVVGIQILTLGLLGQMIVAMGQERMAARSADSHVERVVGARSRE